MKRAAHAGDVLRRCLIVAALVLLAAASFSVASGAPANPPGSLTRYRCYDCHSDREAVVGPAFADVAAFYHGKHDAVSRIAADIRAGIRTGSPWHMPPHPEVSPSEARAMARYILSLDPKHAGSHEVNRR
jgi:cytochrome c